MMAIADRGQHNRRKLEGQARAPGGSASSQSTARSSGQRLAVGLLGLVLCGLFLGAASEAMALSAANVYRNASSSVVLIFGFTDSGAGSSGTGSILTRDGLILTNNHVIAGADSGGVYPNLVVYFKPNPISGDNTKDLTTPYLVDIVARDPVLDLALLRVKDAPAGLRPIEVGDSEEVDIGEPVAAIGHPGGGGLWTLTTGTVSSKRRDQARDIFQTDTAINPGNSGGPLLDENARLIGVNTFVRRVNDQGLPLEGLNYSLRSSLALAWVNEQGVSRVNAVTRAADRMAPPAPTTPSAPQSSDRPETPSRPAPSAEASPAPPAPQAAPAPAPAPPVEPARPAPAPSSPPPPPPPPAPEPEARSFEGPDGEMLYGVPNPQIDLHDALQHARSAYRALIERADESIDEMDRLIDDYDNF